MERKVPWRSEGQHGGRLLHQETANLGGGHSASVPPGIEAMALGQPEGRDSVDFGPGTAFPKGNVGLPSLSTALPHPTLAPVLNSEGAAW